MNKTDSVIYQRPHYYRGQLLLEDDFLAEQNYHAQARRRHSLHLHGWGVVRGLEVTRKTPNSITINAGYAIEDSGQEVFLDESMEVDLAEFGPNELLRVNLKSEETGDSEQGETSQQKRRDICALLSVSRGAGDSTGVNLAALQLDGQGKLGKDAIDYKHTKYVRILAPGSITSADLHESLKTGWLRFPFRPIALVNVPDGETEKPPAFRVGATEALSPRPEEGQADKGAAGTMGIPLPPSVTQVTRLRIAGARNEGKIQFMLLLGGWDPSQNRHARKTLLETEISTPGPFLASFDIDDTPLDPEYQTMSIWLRGTQRTAISLIAIEFVYY
jgi:hypothetical protein